MKKSKILGIVALLSIAGSSFSADVSVRDISDYKMGFHDGFQEGRIFQRELDAKQFQLYSNFLKSLTDFKLSIYTGQYTPYRFEVIREDGKLVVKKIEAPKEFFLSSGKDETVIPAGFWVYADISQMPTDKIAFLRSSLRKMSLKPYTLDKIMIANVFTREADAKYFANVLIEKLGVPFAFQKMEEFTYERPLTDKALAEKMKELVFDIEAIKKKYENIKEDRKDLFKNLVYALQSVDYSSLSETEKEMLKKDLSIVIEMVKNRNVNGFEYVGYYCGKPESKSSMKNEAIKSAAIKESEIKDKPEPKIEDVALPSALSGYVSTSEDSDKEEILSNKFLISVYYGNKDGAKKFLYKLKNAGFDYKVLKLKLKGHRWNNGVNIIIPAKNYGELQKLKNRLRESGFDTYSMGIGLIEDLKVEEL